MAYAQWVAFTIKVKGFDAWIGDASLNWGKFYKWDNKDNELSPDDINKISLTQKKTYSCVICACGRSDAASGTEGAFSIYRDADKTDKVGTIKWDCPWGSKINSWSAYGYDTDNYIIGFDGGSSYGGAIGTVTVVIADIS